MTGASLETPDLEELAILVSSILGSLEFIQISIRKANYKNLTDSNIQFLPIS